jgi:hypothetical protein
MTSSTNPWNEVYKLAAGKRKNDRSNTLKSGNWPVSKHELITKHLESFLTFIKSIHFDQL